ncbi:XAC2610-related protein [Vallitalea okinawensis]|uniref:XAC2610-related protein n=1 Tax=Vallitalea okinawensis TaxID=2078660 RepID=UPI000CFCA366|nr:hypothetical protein [Vallitalea okinawensis]
MTIVDANFDGNLDFYYIDNRGNANYYCRFWIWDIQTESFVESYELNELSIPQFYEETKIVSAFWRDSAVSSETRYYKYIDSKLTSIRYFDIGYPFENEYGEHLHTLRVEDFIDGELVEVFNKDTLVTEEFSGEIYDEFFRWWDLNYYGE